MKKLVLLFSSQFVLLAFVYAQNLNSIYSAYGIGDVNLRTWNGYSAMGGLGVALPSDRTINDINPATFGGINNHRFLLEVAATGNSTTYVTADNSFTAGDFNIKRAAFGMSLFKNMGTVFGLKQYSNVSYKSTGSRDVAGTLNKVDVSIEGSGGLNMAYLGNAYNFGKHLSVGATVGYLFGSINKNEVLDETQSGGLQIVQSNYYQKLYLNTGILYKFQTGKYLWALGASVQPGMQMNHEESIDITGSNSDSVYSSVNSGSGKFKYPLQWAAGITLKKGRSTFGFDYIQQNWKTTDYHGANFSSTNSQNFALGYSYTFKKQTMYGEADKMSLMAGLQRDQSYLVVNGSQVTSNIFTVGVNIPSKSGWFNYTVGCRMGERGRVEYPLVKEKFVELTLNLSLGNMFLTGARKYD